eukprot:scaffold435678_cov15-Prasinocladus_malaysianus.AAC.1
MQDRPCRIRTHRGQTSTLVRNVRGRCNTRRAAQYPHHQLQGSLLATLSNGGPRGGILAIGVSN